MEKFKIKKSETINVYKTIRFPIQIHNKINEILKKENEGKKRKVCSFNRFVLSACEYAIENMEKNDINIATH